MSKWEHVKGNITDDVLIRIEVPGGWLYNVLQNDGEHNVIFVMDPAPLKSIAESLEQLVILGGTNK